MSSESATKPRRPDGKRLTLRDLPEIHARDLMRDKLISIATASVDVVLGTQKTTLRLVPRQFANGGYFMFFVCDCGRWARTMRLWQGKAQCKWCIGLPDDHPPREYQVAQAQKRVEQSKRNPGIAKRKLRWAEARLKASKLGAK